MAKKAAAKAPTPTATIVGISLVDVELSFDAGFEDEENVSFDYHVDITPPKAVEDEVFVFTAELQVTKSMKDADVANTGITATYICGMRCKHLSDADITSAARRYAQTTIWGNFTSLFAVITQQMRAQFPILPPIAGRVVVKSPENELQAAGSISSS